MFILYETKARAEKPDFYPCIIEEKFCFATLGFVRNEQISWSDLFVEIETRSITLFRWYWSFPLILIH